MERAYDAWVVGRKKAKLRHKKEACVKRVAAKILDKTVFARVEAVIANIIVDSLPQLAPARNRPFKVVFVVANDRAV
jgi:hypothetical protein